MFRNLQFSAKNKNLTLSVPQKSDEYLEAGEPCPSKMQKKLENERLLTLDRQQDYFWKIENGCSFKI